MKKVVIFCDYFGNGGIERVAIKTKQVLESNNYDVKIVSTIYDSSLYNDCVSISKSKTSNPIYRFFKTVFNIRKYTKNFDIVHINMHSSISLLYACLIDKTKKIIVHGHNNSFQKDVLFIKSIINYLFKLFFTRKRFYYLACSSSAGNFCFGKNINYKIVPNTIDGKKFIYNSAIRKKIRKKYNISDGTFVVGHIGRFCAQKNHKFIIEIFNKLLSLNSNSILFLIGDGVEKNKIKSLVKEYGFVDKVIFVDGVSDTSLYYQLFDAFLFPSIFEGYGICVYEALCSSLKCFVSDTVVSNFERDNNLYSLSIDKDSMDWAKMIYQNMNYKRLKKGFVDTFEVEIKKVYNLNSEKISVIVPVFNSEKTIRRCIDSILNQSYENFEIIIVNDGSTDKTKKILNEYNDDRIVIINQKNYGTGVARNNGILRTSGKYICFIDGDDEIKSSYLEELYNSIIYFDADVSCSVVNDSNKGIKLLNKVDGFRMLLDLPETISMSVCRKLFKKNVLENISFDVSNHYEDVAYVMKVFLNANSVVVIPSSLYIYHKQEGSRSQLYYGYERIQSCLECFDVIKKDYPMLYSKYIAYTLFNSLGVFNKMVVLDRYEQEVIDYIYDMVSNNFKHVIISHYPFYKKIQLLLFYKFNKLYIFLYKKNRRRVR